MLTSAPPAMSAVKRAAEVSSRVVRGGGRHQLENLAVIQKGFQARGLALRLVGPVDAAHQDDGVALELPAAGGL